MNMRHPHKDGHPAHRCRIENKTAPASFNLLARRHFFSNNHTISAEPKAFFQRKNLFSNIKPNIIWAFIVRIIRSFTRNVPFLRFKRMICV